MKTAGRVCAFSIAAALAAIGELIGSAWADGGAPTERPNWLRTYSALDLGNDVFSTYSRYIIALNRDLSSEGWRLRLGNSYTKYEYSCGCYTIEGRRWQADIMLGYEFFRDGTSIAAFVGADYIDHHLNRFDPFNEVRGDETGVKFAVNIERTGPFYFNLIGEYSTAFNEYWALLRVGQAYGRFTIGPEVQIDGDDNYDVQRLGGFAGFDISILPGMTSRIYASAGYQFTDSDIGAGGREGGYGTLAIGSKF